MGIPKHINADNQFNTKKINDYFDKLGIIKYYSDVGEINKNAIIERFDRTLTNMIQKYRVATKKNLWYKVLNQLVDAYNSSYQNNTRKSYKCF